MYLSATRKIEEGTAKKRKKQEHEKKHEQKDETTR